MKKFTINFSIILLLISSSLTPVLAATKIWLEPNSTLYNVGETITIDLYADIDSSDAIWGFNFDLSFDGGTTYISGTGEKGTSLTFTKFTPNNTYFISDESLPPLWDNGDFISGEVYLDKSDLWGTNIFLGKFSFQAPSSAPIFHENIYLGPSAADYGIHQENGLLGATSLVPNNPSIQILATPIPCAAWLLGTGLLWMFGIKKKSNRNEPFIFF